METSVVYPRVRLVFVGRGFRNDPEISKNGITNLINSLGIGHRVILRSYRSDITRLLKAFDMFCLPFFSEGLPVSILGAMAAKVPVGGSNVEGIKGVISSGNTGLLFPVNDHVFLTKTLERLINDTKFSLRLRQRAFDFVSENHRIRQWVTKYQQVFLSAQ